MSGDPLAISSVSTGAATLDDALGMGGIPFGRITEIFGPESSGKTTLALTVIRNVQRGSGRAAIIDVEHALDLSYAAKLGVDVSSLLVSQPDSAESALEIAEILIRSGIECVVVDSVALLIPEAEIRGGMSDLQVGLQARVMGKALRKLTAPVAENGTALIFINQIRANIGGYGSPEVTPGGKALRFSASVRIALKKKEAVSDGIIVASKVVKNKLGPPLKDAEFIIRFDRGVDYIDSLIELALTRGVLTRSGSWIKWGEQNVGQGKDRVAAYLEKNNLLGDLLNEAR